MKQLEKRPILANGEYYIEPINRKNSPNNKEYPHTYDEAKERLVNDIDKLQKKIVESNEVFIKDKVICVRLEPSFSAKSYEPRALLSDSKMKLIGGRKYNTSQDEKAKLYFIKTNDMELGILKNRISLGLKDNVKAWRNQLCSIRSIDLLDENEKILGFSDEWDTGTVEIVLHPLGENTQDVIQKFLALASKSKEEMAIRTYEDGLTFICAKADKEMLQNIKRYNPLRSVKPMDDELDDTFRSNGMTSPAPQLPEKILKSKIKIGIFDGGVKENIPLLDNYVTRYDLVNSTPTVRSSEHGAAVAGAALFGELSGYTEKDTVENPLVSVEAFRVMPAVRTGNTFEDFEMYSTIDIIEKIVAQRKDIKLYSLSIGPKSAVLDDDINRFTYALDRLTYDVEEDEVNPLFCVAVGNEGNRMTPADRIQAPSDMVNGIAVGAYSYTSYGDRERAVYSCVGPGREGAKIKPDVVEFGGSQTRPFVLILPDKNELGVGIGTSLATPVVAGKIGKLMAESSNIVPHLGRALLIHHAESSGYDGDIEYGFGYVPQDVTDMLSCSDDKVTILYSGTIMASTMVKLPIFLPEINKAKGKINIKWTICTVVNPNVNDPDAYTNNCIEDTFYPNEMVFRFTKNGEGAKVLNLLNPEHIVQAQELLNQGYSKSQLPISKSIKRSYKEEELRKVDYKWDTVIRKQKRMMASSLLNPFITLHAIGRDEYEHEKIRYNVVVTVEAASYEGSLYDNILQKYNNLMPIQMQNINRIMTSVKK